MFLLLFCYVVVQTVTTLQKNVSFVLIETVHHKYSASISLYTVFWGVWQLPKGKHRFQFVHQHWVLLDRVHNWTGDCPGLPHALHSGDCQAVEPCSLYLPLRVHWALVQMGKGRTNALCLLLSLWRAFKHATLKPIVYCLGLFIFLWLSFSSICRWLNRSWHIGRYGSCNGRSCCLSWSSIF